MTMKEHREHRATVRVYLRRNNGWRWRISFKGRIIAASTEAYVTRFSALKNLRSITGAPFKLPRYRQAFNIFWRFGLKDRQVELVE